MSYVTVTNDNGILKFDNLVFGTYQITETATTEGTTLLRDSFVVVLPQGSTNRSDLTTVSYYDEDDGMYYAVDVTVEIENGSDFDVPIAGSNENTFRLALIGGCLILVGFLYARRKKKVI